MKPSVIRYPWKKWFKRGKFTLHRGVDYFCQPHSMGVQIRSAASARCLLIRVTINEGTITVTRRTSPDRAIASHKSGPHSKGHRKQLLARALNEEAKKEHNEKKRRALQRRATVLAATKRKGK